MDVNRTLASWVRPTLLAGALFGACAPVSAADELSLIDAAERLKPGTPYDKVRAGILAAGWFVFPQSSDRVVACPVLPAVCAVYDEATCWSEAGGKRCQMNFRSTDRAEVDLSDLVLTILTEADSSGRLLILHQATALFGGRG